MATQKLNLETLKEVRRALLDADVSFKIAKEFTNTIKEKAIGRNVLEQIDALEVMGISTFFKI